MKRISISILLILALLNPATKAESLIITFTSVVDFAFPGAPFPLEVSAGDQISGVISLDLTALPTALTYVHGQTRYSYAPNQNGLSITITSGDNTIEYTSALAGSSLNFPTEIYTIDSTTSDSFYSRDSILFQIQNSSSNGMIGIGFADLNTPFNFISGGPFPANLDPAYITAAELSFTYKDENSIYPGVRSILTSYSFSLIPESNTSSILIGGLTLITAFARARKSFIRK